MWDTANSLIVSCGLSNGLNMLYNRGWGEGGLCVSHSFHHNRAKNRNARSRDGVLLLGTETRCGSATTRASPAPLCTRFMATKEAPPSALNAVGIRTPQRFTGCEADFRNQET